MTPLVGIFVGGAGRRMGGIAKGFLRVDGEPIVTRTVRIARTIGDVVLVGEATAYEAIAPSIADDPPGIGPLGGLAALLARAGERDAIVLACDMPHVAEADLRELASSPFEGDVLAGRRDADAPWESLFSRWRSAQALPVVRRAIDEGARAFQRVLARLSVVRFVPSDPRSFDDWDVPEDVPR